MRYVIIENGIVVNAAVADEPFGGGWVQSDTANIGDLYDGETFTAPPTQQEDIDAAWRALRSRRDGLLSLCDWTQLPDASVDVEAWATYRQALRDLPANTSDPFDIAWPVSPSEEAAA
jgi:hypothetical protein